MGKIQFGSEVYTWFMQDTGKGYDNKLDHMIKIAGQAGFTGIEARRSYSHYSLVTGLKP